ncbi:potassium transporter [Hanseniaspora valbyensis NRRL Y-1626]|uniref:Potassium transporter n=1 Tax=Hanseniaspora valbyensis NRRL Y-1626 TaxID=766949 RepID=A0A1B7TGZ3_9ASCO|nr:potassium transporter [Hanseniaspora valbyensis NRRL Y-1626]
MAPIEIITPVKILSRKVTIDPDQISLSSNDSNNDISSQMIEAHMIDTNFEQLYEQNHKHTNTSVGTNNLSNNSSASSIFSNTNGTSPKKSVIYGDLGTSPLYVYSTIFADYTPGDNEIYGAMSCIFWLFTIVVIFKYSLIVLNLGPFKKEGGQIAIYVKLIRYLRIKKFNRNTGINEDDYDEVEYSDLEEEDDDGKKKEEQDLEAQHDQTSLSSKISQKSIHDDGVVSFDVASMKSGMFYYKPTFIHKMLSHFLIFCCFLGCSLVLSDGLLTPTTSVLSAVAGISIPVPALSTYVMPISVVILLLLFSMQRFGSGKVSMIFAPIIFVWLITIFVIGIINIIKYDSSVFKSLNPAYAVKFLHKKSFFELGSVLLSITGCEAMFADVGHFNQISIQCTLIFLVYPCLMITYLGQTAFLLNHNDADTISELFFNSIPGGNGFYWFVFIIATLATIIASQALILSVFSILKQLIKLKYFPNFKIIQTSKQHKGQIYIPLANWILMIAVCLTTVGFRNSNNVTAAYGTGISIDFCVTTALITFCIIYIYNKHVIWALLFLCVFGSLDTTLMIATMKKVPTGAWFPLVVCFICVLFLYLYNRHVGKKERELQDLIWKQYQKQQNEGEVLEILDVCDIKLNNNVTVDDKILQWAKERSVKLEKVLKFFI